MKSRLSFHSISSHPPPLVKGSTSLTSTTNDHLCHLRTVVVLESPKWVSSAMRTTDRLHATNAPCRAHGHKRYCPQRTGRVIVTSSQCMHSRWTYRHGVSIYCSSLPIAYMTATRARQANPISSPPFDENVTPLRCLLRW
jgi:hypothetical protein